MPLARFCRMLKYLNPEFALGFLVATIFGAAVLGWQSSYAPTETEKQECREAAKKAGHKTEECKSLWEKTTSDPVAFFTFVLSVSTIGLWAATGIGIFIQTRDTRILQRAYLSVEPGGVAPYASPTATFDPDWRVVALFAQSGETENAVGPVGNNVIPPGSTMNQGGPTRLLGEKGWVYVWGVVTYNDGFVDGRITRFCHRYNLKRLQPSTDGERRIRPKYGRHYERGQDAT
jgi:hypothetical protein